MGKITDDSLPEVSRRIFQKVLFIEFPNFRKKGLDILIQGTTESLFRELRRNR